MQLVVEAADILVFHQKTLEARVSNHGVEIQILPMVDDMERTGENDKVT